MAIDAIRQNKLRSILTLLGISIGVFSVIGVMTAIRTLESSVESGLNVFAANTFVIQKYPSIQIGRRDKKTELATAMRQLLGYHPTGIGRPDILGWTGYQSGSRRWRSAAWI